MNLQAGGTHFQIREVNDAGVLVQHLETNECRLTSEAELIDAILNGRVQTEGQKRIGLYDLSEHVIDKAQVRGVSDRALEVWADQMAWINALRANGVIQIVDVPWVRALHERLARNELVGRRKFALSTLYTIDLKIRKAGGDVTAAVPNYLERGGKGQTRIDPRAAEILQREIKRIENQKGERIVKKNVYQNILAVIDSHNASIPTDPISIPSASTVTREIEKQIPAYEILKRNRGDRVANDRFRQHAVARDTAMWGLEVSEYDDIDTGVFAVDEKNGLPWGRVHLTNGISQSTLVVLGYDIGDKPRSFESAIGAICDSLLPKDGCLPGEMGYGNQGQILLDNARYNESIAIKKQSKALSLLLSAARPYGPTEKSSIEHYNWIVKSKFCCELPGWSGEKGDREALDEGICSAAMTLGEIRASYRHWVTKIYANDPGEDGRTSKQRWLLQYGKHGPAVRYSKEQLALFRLRPGSLKFRNSGGLMRLQLRYWSQELAELQRKIGAKSEIQIFTDHMAMKYIVVVNPYSGELLRVPCSEDWRYVEHLTERQQRTILSMARTRGKLNPSIKDLWEARRELEILVEQSRHSHKIRVQTWARRISREASEADTSPPPQTETKQKLVTELEYQVAELLAGTASEGEEW